MVDGLAEQYQEHGAKMAIDLPDDSIVLKRKDRTWRIEFFIDDNDGLQIVGHREVVGRAAGKIRERERAGEVRRDADTVLAKSYTAKGLTATGEQIIALVNKMIDVERQYDLDNPAPAVTPIS